MGPFFSLKVLLLKDSLNNKTLYTKQQMCNYLIYKGCYITHWAKKCRHHGKNTDEDWQDQPGSLKAKDCANQRGFLQAFLCHLFLPESLQPAKVGVISFSSFLFFPDSLNLSTYIIFHKDANVQLFQLLQMLLHWKTAEKYEPAEGVSDLSPLVSATSNADRPREDMSSLFLNMAHIMGVIQAKVVKDRKPALSTGWDLDRKNKHCERCEEKLLNVQNAWIFCAAMG